ncbi:hypothetical protein PG996_001243 [Apiospora saccharicola]|uniref:Uncharacterized protein n=1 Tax=Apiospora saccharicola TaxID=335842 RepID=A0ABR1WHJ8_9PEZI
MIRAVSSEMVPGAGLMKIRRNRDSPASPCQQPAKRASPAAVSFPLLKATVASHRIASLARQDCEETSMPERAELDLFAGAPGQKPTTIMTPSFLIFLELNTANTTVNKTCSGLNAIASSARVKNGHRPGPARKEWTPTLGS